MFLHCRHKVYQDNKSIQQVEKSRNIFFGQKHLMTSFSRMDIHGKINVYCCCCLSTSGDVMKQPFPQGGMSTGLPYPLDPGTGGQGIDIMGTCREKTLILGAGKPQQMP